MNPSDQPGPNADAVADAIEEQFVAYLDGELAPEERREVEERLARDPVYRARLRAIERTWEMLDLLPRSEATPNFTQTTMKMVAITAEDEVAKQRADATKNQWQAWLAAIAGGALALGIGYFAIGHFAAQPNDRLVRDLPVIENVDRYRNAENLEFLRELDRSGLFAEEVTDAM
jgi:anti-sigma factor RsiW